MAFGGAAAEPQSWLPGLGPLSPPTSARTPARGDRVNDAVGLLGLVLATVHGSCSLMSVDCGGFQHQTTQNRGPAFRVLGGRRGKAARAPGKAAAPGRRGRPTPPSSGAATAWTPNTN